MEENLHEHIAFVPRATAGMIVRDDPDLLLVDSGLPSDTFNKIARARMADSAVDLRIAGAVSYFRSPARPFAWWVGPLSRPLDLEVRLRNHGLAPAESERGMAMQLSGLPQHTERPQNLEVRRAVTEGEIADFASVFAANWQPPDPSAAAFYKAAAPLLLAPHSPMILFLGYIKGEPVATSELFLAGEVAGLYAVATRREFRGRGIGSALTWTACDEARSRGISTAVLQSSAAGKGLYTRLGFRPLCQFTEFTLSAAP
jgi:ribosomal protein S18 acetylase RimI-like enzyme